jgi:cold shock CspA family protein
MQGTIVTWFERRGFGFVKPDDSPTELFIHISDVPKRESLPINTRISYEIGSFGGKQKAVQIRVLR